MENWSWLDYNVGVAVGALVVLIGRMIGKAVK